MIPDRIYFLGMWVDAPEGEPHWFLHEFVGNCERRRIEGHGSGIVKQIDDPVELSGDGYEGITELDPARSDLMVTRIAQCQFEEAWNAGGAVRWRDLWAANDRRQVPDSVPS